MTTSGGQRDQIAAGVIGVGSMGRQHARVYGELRGVELVGVHDADPESAAMVADDYETDSVSMEELLDRATVVSVAVPTQYHYEVVKTCLERDVNVLVEKPFVTDRELGEELATLARQRGLVLQVGHIERFNPATRVLQDVVPDLDLIAFDVNRLGPPLDRDIKDSVVLDLMVHDLDILLALVGCDVKEVSAVANGPQYVDAQLVFEDGTVASLTASRRTRQKIRELSVTADTCRVNVDFIQQTVNIHRSSFPEYVESNGDIRYRHESVVEQPMVQNGEPLKAELESFVTAVREGKPAEVTPEDALRVQALAERIERIALPERREVTAR
jgi:predicted dehydrogenase